MNQPLHLLLVGLAWTLWGTSHSLLASTRIKRAVRARAPSLCPLYRVGFNAVAGLGFAVSAGLSWYLLSDPGLSLFPGPYAVPQLVALGAALWLFAAGARGYDLMDFVGLRQLSGRTSATLGSLAREGVHRLVRHPWYLGTLLLIWARADGAAVAYVNLWLTAYLLVGTVLEERKLAEELGGEWDAYRREVPMLIPRLTKRA
ncbi:MAG: hypothetical protein JXX28_05970 [Deltaproteobacteria bacterium]|nr:hypothetical protein [Deltaproteobacteria bacterium]